MAGNGNLYNSGMQMPLFASANQQPSAADDVDFQELFREYFNEDIGGDSFAYNNPMAQLQAQAMANSLPTGQGIRTAWHGSGGSQQPQLKRSRIEENLYLPSGAAGGLSTLGNQSAMGNGGLGNSGLGVMPSGIPNQYSISGSGGMGGSGLSSLGQTQLQQQNMMAGGMSMGVGGMSNNMMSSNSGGGMMPVSNINYALGGKNTLTQMSYGAPVQGVDKEALEQQMTAERRLRNREHAKRSRVRKKFMLESLQEQVRGLQEENSNLRMLVQKHIPDNALKIIDDCCSSSTLFGIPDVGAGDGADVEGKKSDTTALIKTDFSLIESLTSGQQNFVLSDPRLPDNPIVFATPGFYELTGYTREQVLGRNCRFLQGPGTDPKAVDVIRTAIANGNDATVCLLNYRADGTPFWNQFFVAALRDADNCIVNYVGVQTLVEPNAGASALEEKVNAAHPIKPELSGHGGEDDDEEDQK